VDPEALMAGEDRGFLSRWARRKAQMREGLAPDAPPPLPAPIETPVIPPAPPGAEAPEATDAQHPAAAEPAPTLDDVATLTAESDFRRFVGHDVDPTVKNAALKKLFTDPHYNVMDGLDTYIDDYGKPDPLPEGMLRQMVQSQFLGLFDDEKKTDEPAAAAATAATDPKEDAPNEDADLRLQPHHAADAGEPGVGEPGAGEDAAGQP
jgi:hypothetical protein